MKTAGVITEYNPFHNGHAYQLRALKERTGADYIVVAMSGDYVQRGEPALVDKYARTHMALRNGADLVLEFPVQWATASAEKFARGGVELLAATGVVGFLGFGAEDDALSLMTELAQILADEPEPYRAALAEALRSGTNFPTARLRALENYLANNHSVSIMESVPATESVPAMESVPATESVPAMESAPAMESVPAMESTSSNASLYGISQLLSGLLSRPNNILALEYLKALRRGNYTMEPVLIPRIGDGYHDEDVKSEYASATAIRKRILSGARNISSDLPASPTSTVTSDCRSIMPIDSSAGSRAIDCLDFLETYLPASCLDILSQYQAFSRFLCADDFSQILGYRLLALRESGHDAYLDISPELSSRILRKGGYNTYADISPELSSRILRKVDEYQNFTQFCELLKTKELTYTRISRALLHLVLDIRDTNTPVNRLSMTSCKNTSPHVPYLRILGFRRGAEPLLHEMKQRATLPIVTKMADAPRILDPKALEILQKEIFVSDLYAQIAQNSVRTEPNSPRHTDNKSGRNHRSPKNEVNHGLIII